MVCPQILEFTVKSPKVRTNFKTIDGISHICHFQHLCELPKNKAREESCFEEYTSEERRNEMHVHIVGQKIEKLLSCIKI